MKRFLEGNVKEDRISYWIFVVILFGKVESKVIICGCDFSNVCFWVERYLVRYRVFLK